MIRIKICGITNARDALLAAELGADAIGFVFAPSPRRIDVEAAASIRSQLPTFVTAVGVFVDEEPERMLETARRVRLDRLQLHGDEPSELCNALPLPVIQRIRVEADDTAEQLATRCRSYGDTPLLLDPGSGDGQPFDYALARNVPATATLAGGLDATSVTDAIERSGLTSVDVCSGVERAPGLKDPQRLAAFIAAARSVHHVSIG